jgi:hypothetical protein
MDTGKCVTAGRVVKWQMLRFLQENEKDGHLTGVQVQAIIRPGPRASRL